MKALGHKQPSFSIEIGTNQSNLSAAINGKRPAMKLVEKITKRYPFVNPAWIMWEQGEMFLSENGKKSGEPEAGILTGVMEPDSPAYVRGEGRLEWLERKVRELEDRVRRLEGEAGEKDE